MFSHVGCSCFFWGALVTTAKQGHREVLPHADRGDANGHRRHDLRPVSGRSQTIRPTWFQAGPHPSKAQGLHRWVKLQALSIFVRLVRGTVWGTVWAYLTSGRAPLAVPIGARSTETVASGHQTE